VVRRAKREKDLRTPPPLERRFTITREPPCISRGGRRLRTESGARRGGGENLSRIITFITSGEHREATKTQLALALAQGGSVTRWARARKRDSTDLFEMGQRLRCSS
jgi:hypothetical protein